LVPKVRRGERAVVGQQDGGVGQSRHELTQQLQTFAGQIGAYISDARHIAARVGEIRDQAPSYGIVIGVAHDDRDCRRRTLGGFRRTNPYRHNAIGFESDQLTGKRGKPVKLALCVVYFDNKIFPLDVSMFAHRFQELPFGGSSDGLRRQPTQPVHPSRLLRVGCGHQKRDGQGC
jgi:hypothetical protein